jgi:hypothetical protein
MGADEHDLGGSLATLHFRFEIREDFAAPRSSVAAVFIHLVD